MATNTYESPLNSRYASKEMQYIFSPDKKFSTWRKLWIALAETEKELGLDITDEQIEELKANKDNINYEDAKKREKEVRHEMSIMIKDIETQAKEEAERLLQESNAKIENTIRTIKEAQAEKEKTRMARQELTALNNQEYRFIFDGKI